MSAEWLVQTFHQAGAPGTLAAQGLVMLAAIALVGLALLDGRSAIAWARSDRPTATEVAAVMLLGLLLRLWLPAGPMDIHYRLGAASQDPVLAQSLYGLAFPSVVRLMWAVTGPSDAAVFGLNTVLGTLQIGAVYALSRRLLDDRTAAWIAAAAIAVSPALAHFSRTDIQTTLEVLLMLWGLEALFRPPSVRSALIAGLALGLASVLRPEAIAVVVVAATGSWAVGRRPFPSDRWMALGAVVALPTVLATLGLAGTGVQMHAFEGTHAFDQGLLHPLFLNPEWTPIWVTAGLFLLPFARHPSREIRLWIAGSLVLLTWLVWGFSPEHMYLAGIRHQLRAIPFAALGAGIGLSSALQLARARGPGSWVSAVAVGAALTVPAWVAVSQPPTAHLEYRFVRDHLTEVPHGCWIVAHFNPQGSDAGLVPPWRLSEQLGLDHRWVDADRTPLPREGCAFYYRGSNCWASRAGEDVPLKARLRDRCRVTEGRLEIEPVVEVSVPGRTIGTDFYAPEGELQLGFYRVGDRADLPPPSEASAPVRPPTAVREPPVRPPVVRASERRPETRPPRPDGPVGPAPDPPASWPEDALREALSSEASCPVQATSCESGICVVASAEPTCTRARCGSVAGSVEAEGMLVSWESGDSLRGAVACAVVPVDDPEGEYLSRATRRAQVLLHELLYPE